MSSHSPTKIAKFVTWFTVARRLLFLLFVGALLGAHANSLWDGSLYYILTQPLLVVTSLVLLIGLFVFEMGKEPEQGRKRPPTYFVRLILLLFSAGLLLSPLPHYVKDLGIRHRIQSVSDEARLETWADTILHTPLDKLPIKEHHGNTYYLDSSAFPDYVRHIPIGHWVQYSYCLIDEGSQGRYLEIAIWHNRPEAWGVLFCTPPYDPSRLENRWIRRWKAGMYSWQEVNGIS